MVILVCNSGSSSLKFSVYETDGSAEQEITAGAFEEIGGPSSAFTIKKPGNSTKINIPDHTHAARILVDFLHSYDFQGQIKAIGHRIVHGGRDFVQPCRIEENVLGKLESFIPFAPDHLPQELSIIRQLEKAFPGIPQVACFDTAFHRTMPLRTQRFALPTSLYDEGVIRYGFHGLSCEYVISKLREQDNRMVNGRIIIAHLGNGASMTAVRGGISIETTMGFTPAGGLIMSTRSGDLDPGVLVYLQREKKLTAAAINAMINRQAGLLSLSEFSSDMKILLEHAPTDERASLAVELFCYQSRKFIGALAAALEGLDLLIFTGGIGEHAPQIRENICRRLSFLGIHLNTPRNEDNTDIISAADSSVQVRVIQANEELMIARHTQRILENGL